MVQTALQLLFIYVPVAERTVVGVAVTEPAVVHHQHFYAELGRLLCDIDELVGIEIEIGRFPVVDEYRAALVLVFSAYEVIAVNIVEGAAHFADACIRIYHYHLGRGEFLSAFEQPAEIIMMYAHDSTRSLELCHFRLREEISAIYEIEAVSLAAFLAGVM